MWWRVSTLLIMVLFAAGSKPAAAGNKIETLKELSSAVRLCWTPPSLDHVFAEMAVVVRFSLKSNGELIGEPRIVLGTVGVPEATANAYRDSVISSLRRCLPFPLSDGLGAAIAGRPISIRLIDRRQKLREA
jgi:hypothetical protein